MMGRTWKLFIPYILIALMVMAPLFMPGFILTLDMVFVPHPPLPSEVGSSYLFHAALHYLSYLIPADVLQKVMLFGILLFSGIGTHLLVQRTFGVRERLEYWAACFAGIIYIVNPFVYGRLMAGQYAVLLGYMLLPFFALAFLKFLENPDWKRALSVASFTLAISIVSIHTVGLAAIFTLIALAVNLWRKHDGNYLKAILLRGSAAMGVVVVLSLYWLIPVLRGQGITEQISDFDSVDRAAFATDGGLWQVIQLKGFWAEAQGLFIPVDAPLPFSGLAQLLLWVVIVAGAAKLWRMSRGAAVLWGVTGLAAIILALGTPISVWLGEHVPFFSGYREPHKFAALLVLAYAVFTAHGVSAFLARARGWKWRKYALAGPLFLLPFWVAPALVWGANGQLQSRQYPADWYATNELLKQDEQGYKVLFLPWHHYMKFDFTGRIIAQPADMFFEAPVISSSDPEFAGLKPQYHDQVTRKLNDYILPEATSNFTLGARLAPFHIKYVLLARDDDYLNYAYLDRQRDLLLISETENLKLYRNTAFDREDPGADD